MPNYTYTCSACIIEWDAVVLIADRDSPQPCPECGIPHTERLMAAPMVMRVGHPDSYRRGASYEEQKQIAKLKVKRLDTHPSQRAAVDQEIAGRTKVASTRKDKSNE